MRERQSDFRVDLNLIDARQLIFDRIFGRDDLGGRVVDLDQRTIQRGGLPEPVGPVTKIIPCGSLISLLKTS